MSGLAPVTVNSAWDAGANQHSCYMLLNGIAHDEVPGRPGYTEEGDKAGNSSNVAVSGGSFTSNRTFVELWMTGPFHAIGILRAQLAQTSYGTCERSSSPTGWKLGATLDVIRGIDRSIPKPSSPIVFPGNGATIPMTRFITESPDPKAMCGWSGDVGVPLIAMFPTSVTKSSATITGPSGPIATCTLNMENTSGTAKALLKMDNAVIVMPRQTFETVGKYTASVSTDAGSVTWSFTVDPTATLNSSSNGAQPHSQPDATNPVVTQTQPPPPPPQAESIATGTNFVATPPQRAVDTRAGVGTTRLRAQSITKVRLADSSVAAVSANFTATQASADGFLTIYNCSTTLPTVSTLNFTPHEATANQATVGLDGGYLCLYTPADTDLIVDVNGYYTNKEISSASAFMPAQPVRLLDTRTSGIKLRPNEIRRLNVAPAAAPRQSVAAALNVTAINPAANGHVTLFPCDAIPTTSTLNYVGGVTRPNGAIVPLDSNGDVCVRSFAETDVTLDYNGYFFPLDELGTGGNTRSSLAMSTFDPMTPTRIFDSRSTSPALNTMTGGERADKRRTLFFQVAGNYGIDAKATAISINVTAVGALAPTYITVWQCGSRPTVSNVNITPSQSATANNAIVKLGPTGQLCIYTPNPTHIVVDINGAFVESET